MPRYAAIFIDAAFTPLAMPPPAILLFTPPLLLLRLSFAAY
jgi:hypothetical protein